MFYYWIRSVSIAICMLVLLVKKYWHVPCGDVHACSACTACLFATCSNLCQTDSGHYRQCAAGIAPAGVSCHLAAEQRPCQFLEDMKNMSLVRMFASSVIYNSLMIHAFSMSGNSVHASELKSPDRTSGYCLVVLTNQKKKRSFGWLV